MNDKKLLEKIRVVVKQFKEEFYPNYNGEDIPNNEVLDIIQETLIR